MTKLAIAAAVCVAFFAGMLTPHTFAAVSAAPVSAVSPAQGWNLHIDAEKHFDAHPAEIAHHWCKAVADSMLECQIYDSDAPNAHLVAVETIVNPAAYRSFPAEEQALWHYHKTEIPKVNATLPGLSPAQQKQVVEQISDTYGKIWLLYDPLATGGMPTGRPTVTVLK